MREWQAAQVALYQMLQAHAERPCFLRLCDTPEALWVTDFPRSTQETGPAREALAGLGCRFWQEESKGLWYVDWTLEAWGLVLASLPEQVPAMPQKEALHPAYALCRLLMSHPAPLENQPFEPLRTLVKGSQRPAGVLLKTVPALQKDAAMRLRKGLPLAHAAGRVLAQWLNDQEEQS